MSIINLSMDDTEPNNRVFNNSSIYTDEYCQSAGLQYFNMSENPYTIDIYNNYNGCAFVYDQTNIIKCYDSIVPQLNNYKTNMSSINVSTLANMEQSIISNIALLPGKKEIMKQKYDKIKQLEVVISDNNAKLTIAKTELKPPLETDVETALTNLNSIRGFDSHITALNNNTLSVNYKTEIFNNKYYKDSSFYTTLKKNRDTLINNNIVKQLLIRFDTEFNYLNADDNYNDNNRAKQMYVRYPYELNTIQLEILINLYHQGQTGQTVIEELKTFAETYKTTTRYKITDLWNSYLSLSSQYETLNSQYEDLKKRVDSINPNSIKNLFDRKKEEKKKKDLQDQKNAKLTERDNKATERNNKINEYNTEIQKAIDTNSSIKSKIRNHFIPKVDKNMKPILNNNMANYTTYLKRFEDQIKYIDDLDYVINTVYKNNYDKNVWSSPLNNYLNSVRKLFKVTGTINDDKCVTIKELKINNGIISLAESTIRECSTKLTTSELHPKNIPTLEGIISSDNATLSEKKRQYIDLMNPNNCNASTSNNYVCFNNNLISQIDDYYSDVSGYHGLLNNIRGTLNKCNTIKSASDITTRNQNTLSDFTNLNILNKYTIIDLSRNSQLYLYDDTSYNSQINNLLSFNKISQNNNIDTFKSNMRRITNVQTNDTLKEPMTNYIKEGMTNTAIPIGDVFFDEDPNKDINNKLSDIKNIAHYSKFITDINRTQDLDQNLANLQNNLEIDMFYILKYKAQMDLLKYIIFTCCVALLGSLAYHASLIPSTVYTLYLIAVFSIGFILVIHKYFDIFIRSKLDFNERDYNSIYKPSNNVDKPNTVITPFDLAIKPSICETK